MGLAVYLHHLYQGDDMVVTRMTSLDYRARAYYYALFLKSFIY